VPRVDDRRIVSGIVFVIRNGLRWCDAPKEYGPHKTIYNRIIRWSRLGLFDRIFAGLAAKGGKPAQKGAVPRCIGRTKSGLNSKPPFVCDGDGRLRVVLLSEDHE